MWKLRGKLKFALYYVKFQRPTSETHRNAILFKLQQINLNQIFAFRIHVMKAFSQF